MNYIIYLLLIIIIVKITKYKEYFYFKQDIHSENRVKINDNYYSKGDGYFVSVNSLNDKSDNDTYTTKHVINEENNIDQGKINVLFNKIMDYNINLLDKVN
mgnify:CR=1 FL=1